MQKKILVKFVREVSGPLLNIHDVVHPTLVPFKALLGLAYG